MKMEHRAWGQTALAGWKPALEAGKMPAVPGAGKKSTGPGGLCSQGDRQECLSLPKARKQSTGLSGQCSQEGRQECSAAILAATGPARCWRYGHKAGWKPAVPGAGKRAQALAASARRRTGRNACRYLAVASFSEFSGYSGYSEFSEFSE